MAYELIETIELTSDAASIEFTNIPQDGTDLALRISVKTSRTIGSTDNLRIDKNGSTQYVTTGPSLYADPVYSIGSGNGSYIYATSSGGDTQTWTNLEAYISNYATTKAQNVHVYGAAHNYVYDPFITQMSTNYASGSAITSLKVRDLSTDNIVSGSIVSLYKIY